MEVVISVCILIIATIIINYLYFQFFLTCMVLTELLPYVHRLPNWQCL